ncbi:hypothetical protein [Glycomyces paridis]|uniref:DUF3592 domain-containing protein n=1 Tax=Glycomyces paridis TaxID=2126555 RepID=A0A4S8PA80_9ACTN|nr:hypothetical protein [Glycomyces paridis]THV26465.1 hypothetical protein E9998_18060 [Glycomyces paridis]
MHADPHPNPGRPFSVGRELALAALGPAAVLVAVMTSRWIEYFGSEAVRDRWLEPSYLLLLLAAVAVVASVLLSRIRARRGLFRVVVPLIGAFGAFCFSVVLGDAALHQRGVEVTCHVETVHHIAATTGRGGHGPQTSHGLDCGAWPFASLKTARDAELAIGSPVQVTHDPLERVDPAVGGVDANGELIWSGVGTAAIAVSVAAWLLAADDGRLRNRILRRREP